MSTRVTDGPRMLGIVAARCRFYYPTKSIKAFRENWKAQRLQTSASPPY